MARVVGVDLGGGRRVEVGLTYIFGIGLTTSQKILSVAEVSPDTRVKDLTEEEMDWIKFAALGRNKKLFAFELLAEMRERNLCVTNAQGCIFCVTLLLLLSFARRWQPERHTDAIALDMAVSPFH